MSDKTVIQFGAEWCVPCKRMRPIAEAVAQKEGVTYVYCDVEAGLHASYSAESFGVKSLPTFVLLDGKDVVSKEFGMMTPAKFTDFLNPMTDDALVDEQGDESFPASDPPGNY